VRRDSGTREGRDRKAHGLALKGGKGPGEPTGLDCAAFIPNLTCGKTGKLALESRETRGPLSFPVFPQVRLGIKAAQSNRGSVLYQPGTERCKWVAGATGGSR
jgi:hypothetical protein